MTAAEARHHDGGAKRAGIAQLAVDFLRSAAAMFAAVRRLDATSDANELFPRELHAAERYSTRAHPETERALPQGAEARRLLLAMGIMLAACACAWLTAGAELYRITSGGSHEAPRVTPGTVAGGAAGSRTLHNPVTQTSKFAERSQRPERAMALMLGDTGALPPARSCGARAKDDERIVSARAVVGASPVVRLTGGFTLVDAQASHLSMTAGETADFQGIDQVTRSRGIRGPIGARSTFAQRTTSYTVVTGGESAASVSGPIGFDTERESEAIVQAVSVRFEQLATPNCKRQRSFRPSHRGLNGAERARLSSSASVSTPTRDRPRHPASAVLNSAGGGGPLAPGYRNGRRSPQKADYARERTSEATFVDPGSNPGGSTPLKLIVASAEANCCGRRVPVAGESGETSRERPASGVEAGPAWGWTPVLTGGSRPSRSAHSKNRECAQEQAIASRLASEDNHASGSAAAQPELIGGVA